MTEDEAKTKWCPFVRAFNGKLSASAGSFNAIADRVDEPFTPTGRCIASACMAWRLDTSRVERLQQADRPEGPGWVQIERALWSRISGGYCGLAGTP